MLEDYYEEAGPDWKPILECLDEIFVNAQENWEGGDTVRINQVKEKFGGLRVYFSGGDLEKSLSQWLFGATMMAETMSFRTCEKCGKTSSDTRSKKGDKGIIGGWVKSLCEDCHVERDKK